MKPLILRQSISIEADKKAVWNALINPVMTKQYMFGCEPVTDWKPRSTILWNGEYEGKTTTFVKGHIIDIRPESFLAYTVIDPLNPEIPDVPDNYLTVTYELIESGGITEFTVTQEDYAKVAQGQKRFEDTQAQGGWMTILEAIKNLVESD